MIQAIGLSALRAVAEHGARVGWAGTPAGGVRFAVRQAGLVLLPDSGHLPHLESPRALARALLQAA